MCVVCPASAIQYTDPDDIKPVSTDHWPTVACQIWPRDTESAAHAAGFAAGQRCLQFLVGLLVCWFFINLVVFHWFVGFLLVCCRVKG